MRRLAGIGQPQVNTVTSQSRNRPQRSGSALRGYFYTPGSPTIANEGSSRGRVQEAASSSTINWRSLQPRPIRREPTCDRRAEIRALIDRVTVESTMIRIALSVHAAEDGEADNLKSSLDCVIAPSQARDHPGRERRSGRRAPHASWRACLILIDAIRQAHRWLGNLVSNPNETVEAIASREGKTERSIRMTLSPGLPCAGHRQSRD